MLESEVAVVKSHYGISVKWSRYRDTGTTDPSLIETKWILHKFEVIILILHHLGKLMDINDKLHIPDNLAGVGCKMVQYSIKMENLIKSHQQYQPDTFILK